MELAYVLAVDGGASSTTALLADTTGRVVGWGAAGPSNHLHGEAGKRRLYNALNDSIGGALEMVRRTTETAAVAARLQNDGVACAALGMTGVRTGSQGADLVAEYVRRIVPATDVVVSEDAQTALLAASKGGPGILVYAGTGSIGFGRSPAGDTVRVGGWGYLIDDEGGGYKVGQAVLKAVFRAFDGRGERTALSDKLLSFLGVPSHLEAHARIYEDDGMSRPHVARLATLAGEAAAEGDAVARRILTSAAEALAGLAVAAARRIGDDRWKPAVYPSGGVFQAGRSILDPFGAAVRAAIPSARVALPAFEPIAGAYLMALAARSVPVTDELLLTLQRSGEALGLPAASNSAG